MQSIILLLLVLSWANTAAANIVFVNFAPNTTFKPGDNVVVRWSTQPAGNGTVESAQPFNLELRALSTQRYDIMRGISQSAFTVTVQIPSNATGGKHSFYAFYQGDNQPPNVRTNQFIIEAPFVNPTIAAPGSTATGPSTPNHSGSPAADTGLSGGALAGIIGGVVVLLLLVALIFFFRHRRRVVAANKVGNGSSVDDHKERGFTSGPDAYNSKNQDKESLTRSAGSAGGQHFDDGMVAVPLNGGPGSHGPRSLGGDDPRPQQQMQHAAGPTRGPFEASPPVASPHQHQYQPPPPGGMPNPLMAPPPHAHQQQQLQRNQSPYQQSNRDSLASEVESAYDPAHARMMNKSGNAGPLAMQMRGASPMHGSPSLSHSASGRSINSSRYPQNMSPKPQHQNPFTNQQDQEILAAAAAVAAAASPVISHRELQSQAAPGQQGMQDSRSMSPMARSASPRLKEIEMQPLDIQQHHFEQQQKMLQRQQQQQLEQQQQQEQQKSAPSTALPAAQKSINPTQFDDKAEVEEGVEEDNVPVYNGYRDTIFGAYAHNPDDDDEDEDGQAKIPVPAVPTSILTQSSTTPNAEKEPSSTMTTAIVEIQRKKSVKFTGVPSTGPIVLPNQEAAKEHQQQRQQKKQQQQQQQQQQEEEEQENGNRPISEAYTEDYDSEYEDEDDIRMRLMETEAEAVSPVPSHASSTRPQINTNTSVPGQGSVLSPVRSPDETSSYPNHMYVAPPPPQQEQQQRFKPPTAIDNSPSMNTVSAFGNGFYEDVLAAVDKQEVPTSPTSPQSHQQQQHEPDFQKPLMPPVPQSPSSSAPPQQFVQQQHIPAPQAQHFGPVTQEVFGAPSPRITPATAAINSSNFKSSNNNVAYPLPLASPPASTSPLKPALSPRSNARPLAGATSSASVEQTDNDAFYENALL
ncbi:hypothetical protein BGX28_004218 [Mortierella sp. GBA30]|nr:hypothetical protein BGX28_004218 [Mortierella sp. GBA30]